MTGMLQGRLPILLPRTWGQRTAALLPPLCLTIWLAVGLVPSLTGCERIEDGPTGSVSGESDPSLPHSLVERDLERILASGTVRMATRYNSSSYFIHKGSHAGFEYELFALFARQQSLTVEVIVPDPLADLVTLLNNGSVDVLAMGEPFPDELQTYVASTHPYNFVHKVLVLPADDDRPATLSSLEGLTIHMVIGSPFRNQMQELRDRYQLRFYTVTTGPMVEQEELISRVSRGDIDAAVVNDNLARAAISYLPNIRLGTQLSEMLPIGWQVRQNCPELLAALNVFLKDHFQMTNRGPRRSRDYGILYERYYGNQLPDTDANSLPDRPDWSGRISPWDELIRAAADSAGLDWRLVTALVYQESRFDPAAVSNAGACGLMQIMPELAGDEADLLSDPEINIRIGVGMLKEIYDSYAYLDAENLLPFTLATYHAGVGHMADARRLAIDAGKDPNIWRGALDRMLPRLMQRRYFDKARHGFFRGSETVTYVQSILNRYSMYRRLVPQEGAAEELLRNIYPQTPAPE
jgi:membrane-bound lytic murein transglycosylase F